MVNLSRGSYYQVSTCLAVDLLLTCKHLPACLAACKPDELEKGQKGRNFKEHVKKGQVSTLAGKEAIGKAWKGARGKDRLHRVEPHFAQR